MKTLVLYLICAVMLLPQQESDLKLEVGAKIPRHLMSNEPGFIARPDFLPSIQVEIAGVSYVLAYYEKTEVIRYIFTSDEKFVTKDELRVGMCLKITKEQIGSRRGGITRGPKTEDEWIPVIGYQSHIITCRTAADGSPASISVNDLPAEGRVEVRILEFMK